MNVLLFIKQCLLKFISGNKSWSTIVGAKLQFDLVIFTTFYSKIPLDFHELVGVVPLKYLIYSLAGINAQ